MQHGVQLALVALVAAGAGGTLRAAEAEPLQTGAQIRGEITSEASLNHSDGSRSRLYVIELGERELVSFDVSGPLRARLSLFDGKDLVARSSEYHPASLVMRAPKSAAYTLAVSGADSEAFGPYTLNSQMIDGWDGRTLRAGDEVLDWVDESRELPLRVDRQGMYTIDLSSDQFDTVVSIVGNDVDASDDDGGEGTDSRLSVLLDRGDYVLTVSGWGGGAQGLYRLAVNSRPMPSGLNQGGRIRADGSELQGVFQGTPLQYGFSLRERRLVTADMRSTDFDPLLTLRGEGVEYRDDDGGNGLDARLVRVLEPGDYVIDADAAVSGAGLFTLALSSAQVPEGTGGGALAPGAQQQAVLLPGMTDRYTFTAAEEREYVIDMMSDDFDSWLELFDADGRSIANDDDGGDLLNARIRIRLTPGDYAIGAGAIGGSGSYRISISER